MPLHIIRQDITKIKCDAIVNSTNRKLVGFSGVDYAIHTAAGPLLEEACKKIYPLALGSAKITGAYDLPSKYIIHTSGPIWQGGYTGESSILKSCYIESLKLATEYGCKTIAFPLISSGAYGYPKDQVLKFAIDVIIEYLYKNEMTVYLCVFDKTSYEFSKKLFDDIIDFVTEESEEEWDLDLVEAGDKEELDIQLGEADFKKESGRRYFGKNLNISKSESFPLYKRKENFEALSSYLKDMDKPFIETLFAYIDEKGMTDVECYKKANVDRKTFNKLKNNPKQKPSKQTAVAFAIALKLNFDETQHLHQTTNTESTLTFHKWGYFLCFCYKFHFYFMINLTKIVGASCARPQI